MKEISREILKTLAQNFVDTNWDTIINDIATLIAIPSVADFEHATPKHPSGAAAYEALECALGIARRLGLRGENEAGEIAYADLPGDNTQEENMLALMCHADVVSPGDGWSLSPWKLKRKDGYLIGRGVLDDKGPLIVALWAIHFFKHMDFNLPYTVRMIIGTNEETGDMRDAKYYLAHHAAPAFMFTPDNAFPICYGEKGMFHAHIASDILNDCDARILDFTTFDTPINAVPGKARIILKTNTHALAPQEGLTFEYTHLNHEPCVIIEAVGKGGHASLPQDTKNAVAMLIQYVLKYNLLGKKEAQFASIMQQILQNHDGSGLNIQCSDEHFGELTCILSTVSFKDNQLVCGIDIRFPMATTATQLSNTFNSCLESIYGELSYTSKDPFVIDPQTEIIQTLSKAYTFATGKDGKPFTIGGGTYAREFPHAVSFGVEDSTHIAPSWVGPMHGADEGVSEQALKEACVTYIISIYDFMSKDFPTLIYEKE